MSGESLCASRSATTSTSRSQALRAAALGHLGDAVLLADGSPSKLCALPSYSARAPRDVESLADGLWKASICEGRFSYRGGIWQEFDADDLTFIRHAFENLLEP